MNTTASRQWVLTILSVSMAIAGGACNVNGSWTDRQRPDGPIDTSARTRYASQSSEAINIAIAESQEVDLVEAVVSHRTQYRQNLEKLRSYYDTHGYVAKQTWAEFELGRLNKVLPFKYVMDAEIPSNALRAVDQIEEADALYANALDLMKRGGHGKLPLHRQDLMIEAAQVFKSLIEQYPSSDKIDDAAFFCGEIHKDYLPGQEEIAVKWYERAWTWNPSTPHPARFQAAVVHDYRLHDRDRALELYHGVVQNETANATNVRSATRRINALTSDDSTEQ